MTDAFDVVNYHTGFYRFVHCGEFKIDGIPCVTQGGEESMVFFTETNLIGNKNVVPVKKKEKHP